MVAASRPSFFWLQLLLSLLALWFDAKQVVISTHQNQLAEKNPMRNKTFFFPGLNGWIHKKRGRDPPVLPVKRGIYYSTEHTGARAFSMFRCGHKRRSCRYLEERGEVLVELDVSWGVVKARRLPASLVPWFL